MKQPNNLQSVARITTRSITARRARWNDYADLPAVVEAAVERSLRGPILAEAEFDRAREHMCLRQQHGIQSVIPAKHGK